jgi:hypothetical protein
VVIWQRLHPFEKLLVDYQNCELEADWEIVGPPLFYETDWVIDS